LMADMLSERAVKKGLGKDKVVVEKVRKVTEREMAKLLTEREVIGEIKPYDTVRDKVERRVEVYEEVLDSGFREFKQK